MNTEKLADKILYWNVKGLISVSSYPTHVNIQVARWAFTKEEEDNFKNKMEIYNTPYIIERV